MATSTIVGVDDAAQDTDSAGAGSKIVLVPVVIVHADGSSETVYIQQSAACPDANPVHKTAKVHRHLSMVYIVIGSVALAITAIATLIQLRAKDGK